MNKTAAKVREFAPVPMILALDGIWTALNCFL